MAELLNAQTSLGGGGEHIVDSLLVITAVTFLTATFRALARALLSSGGGLINMPRLEET